MTSERGSALVEGVLALTVLTTTVVGGLSVSYLAIAHLWMGFHAQEAATCLVSNGITRQQCRRKLNRALKFLPWGTPQITRFRRLGSLASVEIQLQCAHGWKVRVRRRILPFVETGGLLFK